MASKGIEQRHMFLLYVILNVIYYHSPPAEARQGAKTKPWESFWEQQKTHPLRRCVTTGPPSMKTKHKEEQIKAYLNTMQNHKNTPNNAVKEEKGCILARVKSWMGQTE